MREVSSRHRASRGLTALTGDEVMTRAERFVHHEESEDGPRPSWPNCSTQCYPSEDLVRLTVHPRGYSRPKCSRGRRESSGSPMERCAGRFVR